MAIIDIVNVSKRFGKCWKKGEKEKFYALNDISLRIEEGEVFGILGPNGAGKTTLLNIVMGIVYPDAGSVKATSQSCCCWMSLRWVLILTSQLRCERKLGVSTGNLALQLC